MIGENNIPKHWGRTKASEVGKLLRGVNYKKEEASSEAKINYLPVLRGNNINGELNFDDLVYVQAKNVSKEQLIKSGDIVFAMSSGSKHLVGKSAKAKTDFNGSFGAFCGVFRPNENFDKDFVAYFFQSPYYKKIISEISKGTNINNLKREHILDLDFPIPPLPEQLLIVSKIEQLLSELENGKQQLQTAQQQLKAYRQSLLKWAFEGKLTNKDLKEGELPKGWKRASIGNICDMKAGFFVKADNIEKEFRESLFPCYGGNGLRGYTNSFTHKGKYSLVGRQGALCGNVHLVNGIFHATEHAVVTSPKSGINTDWLFYKLTAMKLNQYSAGAAQPGLSVNKLLKIEVFYPPLFEQQLIVDELESKLTVCEKIEETISQSLQQAETLRQSILKKAFEGKLVKLAKK